MRYRVGKKAIPLPAGALGFQSVRVSVTAERCQKMRVKAAWETPTSESALQVVVEWDP